MHKLQPQRPKIYFTFYLKILTQIASLSTSDLLAIPVALNLSVHQRLSRRSIQLFKKEKTKANNMLQSLNRLTSLSTLVALSTSVSLDTLDVPPLTQRSCGQTDCSNRQMRNIQAQRTFCGKKKGYTVKTTKQTNLLKVALV